MKIIIFGASGTGKTTLGHVISEELGCVFLDSDDYYWKKTNPPFQLKIPLEKRNARLKNDFTRHDNVIVSGSLCTWSKYWDTAFDIGVFLRVPQDVRMTRLATRELDRYGAQLNTDPELHAMSKEFLEWAKTYDDESTEGASIRQHLNWIEDLDCTIIEINGDYNKGALQKIVLQKIQAYLQERNKVS